MIMGTLTSTFIVALSQMFLEGGRNNILVLNGLQDIRFESFKYDKNLYNLMEI